MEFNGEVGDCSYIDWSVIVYSKIFKQKISIDIYDIVIIPDDCVISIIVSKNKRLSTSWMTLEES